MGLICADLADALERLIAELLGKAPGPPRPASLLPIECARARVGLDADTQAVLAKVLALVPAANDVQQDTRINIVVARFVDDADTPGATELLLGDPRFDYRVTLNTNAVTSAFHLAAAALHEFGHVHDALAHGFLPPKVAALLDKDDYVALVWQWELTAWRFMLDGLREVVAAEDRFRRCLGEVAAVDVVLAALNSAATARAKDEIKGLYELATLEEDWRGKQGETVPSELADALFAYQQGVLMPDPEADWDLVDL